MNCTMANSTSYNPYMDAPSIMTPYDNFDHLSGIYVVVVENNGTAMSYVQLTWCSSPQLNKQRL